MTEFPPEPQGPMAYPHQLPAERVSQPQSAPMPVQPQPLPVATTFAPSSGPVGFGVEEPGVAGSWLLATGAAIVVGAISAFAYAAVTFAIQREVLMLVVIIGAAVGMTVALVAKRTGVVTGLVAALIAGASVLLADVLMVVFFTAGSIPKGMSRLADVEFGTAISAYFSDPLGDLWLAAALFAAYKAASSKDDKESQ